MDFRNLKTFEVVASFMSFNRAAEVLHCAQSTVSAQISLLERDLGVPVFERLGRRIALTPAGEELLHRVRRMLSYEHEIRAAVQGAGDSVGLISLRVPQSVAELHMPRILERFCADHPRVGFDIQNCGYFHLSEELRTGEIDAGFLLSMPLDSADLCCTEVFTEPLAYVASPSSGLANREGLTLEDLAGHTLILPKHDCAYRMMLQQDIAEAGIETAALMEMNSIGAVVESVKAGIGVSMLPEATVAAEIKEGRLVKLRWHTNPATSLYFIRHRDKPVVGAFGDFVALVDEYFAGLRGHGGACDGRKSSSTGCRS
ncbi:MAG TPA: LysR family transcriptional regulator [Myxococcota bacterium]|nr:LysR family transcriptional regulator [Myxococcota bacterium]HQP95993.1 LysR family transcriptional regulator [Myxococcota bacterium]